jgi:histone deacetylase 1/2
VRKFNLPTLVLGGGGYTIRNVARCWVLETATVLNRSLPEELPFNDYFEYYAPDFSLSVPQNNMPDLNTPEYLHNCTSIILENLRHVQFAPSVQSHAVPKDTFVDSGDDMDDAYDDVDVFDSHDLWALSKKKRQLDEEEVGASYHPSNPTSMKQDDEEEED